MEFFFFGADFFAIDIKFFSAKLFIRWFHLSVGGKNQVKCPTDR